MQVAAHAIRGVSPLIEHARLLLEAVAPIVKPLADALDSTDGLIENVDEVRTLDPAAKPGAAYVPKPIHDSGGTVHALPSAVDIAGPTGFRLGWYRDMLSTTLAAGVPTWEPQRHLYGLVKDFIDPSGKGLRPALCIATARALGGRAEDAYPAAAGTEMLHNAFLVHDDIEDGSLWRRGVATMHRRAECLLP
jgi:hypothetical protein